MAVSDRPASVFERGSDARREATVERTAGVLGQNLAKMPLAEDQQVIQALVAPT